MSVPALAYSELDSSRFGMRIFRGRLDNIAAKDLATEIMGSNCDVAIVRVPSALSSVISELSQWALPVLHADTLVYYRCDLDQQREKAPRNGNITLTLANASDISDLRTLIANTFQNYVNHYSANDLFPHDRMLAGYQEWAEAYVSAPDRHLWIIRRQDQLVAFLASQDRPNTGETEIILNGVSPDHAGGGLYSDLVRHTITTARSRGMRTLKVSTQVGNFAVQKVWTREGFHLFEALDTFHVNALLSTGDTIADCQLRFDATNTTDDARKSGHNDLSQHGGAHVPSGNPEAEPPPHVPGFEVLRRLQAETRERGVDLIHVEMAFLQTLQFRHPYHLTTRIVGNGLSRANIQAVSLIKDPDNLTCAVIRSRAVPTPLGH